VFTTQKECHRIAIVDGYDRRVLQRRGRHIIATPRGGEDCGDKQKEEHRDEFSDNGFSGDCHRG
jgi:hypothetical protein